MALKKKLKSIISDIRESTGGKTPEEETLPALLVESPAVAKFKEHLAEANDPHKEQEIVASIEDAYYKDETNDLSQYELEKLPEELDLNQINKDRRRLKNQLQSVSRKVSELVLENHPAYARELERVIDLQQSLQKAVIVCANGRRQLCHATDNFTVAGLGLLANYKKRQQLVGLLKSLATIKTLQRTDVRLREMVEEEDYPGAIQLCLECQQAAVTLKHYHCISELSSKLQDTLEMIEESLDVALSKTCGLFDENHYGKVQAAYRLLGKTQTAMDQLHMHFTSAIHNTAFTIVLGYVELCSGTGDTNFQKRQYADLCKPEVMSKYISQEVFTVCLIDLCKALWEVMRSYHKTIQWHEKHELGDTTGSGEQGLSNNDSTNSEPTSSTQASAPAENTEQNSILNKQYIRQKLSHGLVRVWGDVQQKVRLYLLSTDLSTFKYDEFIQVLDIVNTLMLIGEEFCGSKSESLQESIRKQSLNYFRNYHRARIDELRMFLENEGWELCPVKSNFSILMLQEFKFMKTRSDSSLNNNSTSSANTTSDGDHNKTDAATSSGHGYFKKFAEEGSPFDVKVEDDKEEDVFETNGTYDESGSARTLSQESDSDDDVPDELKQDYVDEMTGETPTRAPTFKSRSRSRSKSGSRMAPIVTNTTLNVCRLFGKYMQMMSVLKPIAFDVTLCMSQLFDYYLYTVYSFFVRTGVGSEDTGDLDLDRLSAKLRATLKRIREHMIISPEQLRMEQHMVEEGAPEQAPSQHRDKVGEPHLSPVVNLTAKESLQGLAERCVATESLVFLADQFVFLQSHLESLIPQAKKAFLQQFYSQTISTASELRVPVYAAVAAHSVNAELLLQMMNGVRFDIKDIMSQHSQYVDIVLQELDIFSRRIDLISRRVPIPKVVSHVLWAQSIRIADMSFVEGYAGARKCTNEGRALMQLDFQQFLLKLEKLTDLRPIPGREYVEGYIKAFYFPEAQLESFIVDHKEYSARQLSALVNCVAHINKKSRQRLTNIIEELDKNRR